MLRFLAIAMLTTTQAWAWEFTSDSICTLDHDDRDAAVRVIYDPSKQIYAISITPARPWRSGPVFGLRFDGQRSNTISTNRHIISDDNATLTVTDSGFGNVLDGLEFNQTATAFLGDQAFTFGLDNAAPAVREFRACASGVRV